MQPKKQTPLRQLSCPLENADVVVDPLLLVLRYALGDPSDIADFLSIMSVINF